jgi:hypothetical protein
MRDVKLAEELPPVQANGQRTVAAENLVSDAARGLPADDVAGVSGGARQARP